MSSPTGAEAPLFHNRHDAARAPALAVLLGRAGGRPDPSMLVTAVCDFISDLIHSKPVLALEMSWNMAFVFVSAAMLACTTSERPNSPIRLWIVGYVLLRFMHVVLLWLTYRHHRSRWESHRGQGTQDVESQTGSDDDEGGNDSDSVVDGSSGNSSCRFLKRCESLISRVSLLWWLVGFYWVVSGGDILLQDAPRLYWLSVVILAFDVCFVIFNVVMMCLVGIALCCCLPGIIAILYGVAGQEGASEADLSILPKYRFRILSNEDKPSGGAGSMVPIETSSAYLANERLLLPEDTECCICLYSYEDEAELHALPCNHHFHSSCIVKWLKMNATCPLCKYNILKGNEQV
ncbi:E3 ubiquitin protein ligase RIE1-like [Vigna unguiculata]|uniref:RING-type E3 ubiquitin transferase n=1 Tax=Vigna unguiculata TaxID=3917 RepID=A0A4D6LM05_VIGUN|nr:E3 ubiquitin protein ligase RIE1-like [Vigna unguiculata]QCD89570.1 integrator complex subunit 11 [Vigna unguiculata]